METKNIKFNSENYQCRVVKSNNNEVLIIGSCELLDVLHPGSFAEENEGFTSEEAKRVYDDIFYFTSSDNLKLDDKNLVQVLKENNPDWFE